MKDLKCGLRTCTHNKGYCCCAKQISVNKNTDCLTYSPDQNNQSLFEAGSDFVTANYAVDTKVDCGAGCIFQRDKKCISNGITVMTDGASKAACLTFIKV